MTEEREMLVLESTGEDWLEEEFLKEELPQVTFIPDAKLYAKRQGWDEEKTSRFLEEMEKFAEDFGPDTELRWYDDMFGLAGSAGLVLLRKGTNKVINAHAFMRA